MIIPDDYKCAIVRDEANDEERYVCLLSRLSNLAIVSMNSLLDEKRFRLLAGDDKWHYTILKAFTMLHEGEDYKAFLKFHAYEKTPYMPPNLNNDASTVRKRICILLTERANSPIC